MHVVVPFGVPDMLDEVRDLIPAWNDVMGWRQRNCCDPQGRHGITIAVALIFSDNQRAGCT
jgi:hypothetical protein